VSRFGQLKTAAFASVRRVNEPPQTPSGDEMTRGERVRGSHTVRAAGVASAQMAANVLALVTTVALARALVNEPAVLLLDEPLGALDLKLRKQMGIELKRIQREVGITFIYVTHDQEEAMTMSDRIAVMNKGRYEQLAGPETLYERPSTRFVAGFVGASNLLEGKIGSDGDLWTVTLPSGAVVRAPKSLGDIGSGGAIGVRPEKLTLLEPGQESKGNTLEGTVVDTSYLGVITQYVVEGKNGLRLLVSEQNRDRTTRNDTWRPGESVTLTWKPENGFVVGDAAGA